MRNAWLFASAVYEGPCKIWIDQARSASTQSATPTIAARPPTRTKKPELRKYGASAREYGFTRARGRLRGSVIRRGGSGVENGTAGRCSRGDGQLPV